MSLNGHICCIPMGASGVMSINERKLRNLRYMGYLDEEQVPEPLSIGADLERNRLTLEQYCHRRSERLARALQGNPERLSREKIISMSSRARQDFRNGVMSGDDFLLLSGLGVDFDVRNKKRTVVCDETGERWESISACSNSLGVSPCAVRSAVNEGYDVMGRRLRYEDLLPSPPRERIVPKSGCKAVTCLETGVTYESVSAACRELGIKDNHCITDAIRDGSAFHGNHWAFADPAPASSPGKGRRVRNMDAGRVFESIAAAARSAGISRNAISTALRRGKNEVLGHRFE